MSTATTPPVERKPEVKKEGTELLSKGVRARPLFDPEILRRAIKESFVKLNPRMVAKNPVMFVVEVGAALTTVFVIKDAITGAGGVFFGIQIAFWLWFTVVFANFAEAMAEARGKAQADALRKTKTDTMARKLLPNGKFEMVSGFAVARRRCRVLSKPVISFRETAKSSMASPASMNRSSPEKARRSFANPEEIAAP